ncbi:MAG: hypothetical protein IPK35_00875 [Saprospiraceae bacterium]|nr:hypothetical protein [Saprospiraceae bacterium]
MNAYKSNLFHAVVLIFLSIWEYYSALNPSIVQLLPLFFGVIFLSLNNGVQYGLQGQTKAALVLSIFSIVCVILIFLYLYSSIDILSIFRYATMILAGCISVFYLFKSVFKNVKN